MHSLLPAVDSPNHHSPRIRAEFGCSPLHVRTLTHLPAPRRRRQLQQAPSPSADQLAARPRSLAGLTSTLERAHPGVAESRRAAGTMMKSSRLESMCA
jgi:hypothetical protein